MPTTDAVSGGSNINYVGSPKEDKAGTGLTADMDTFLQLLVAQMQYQDPLEPKKDSDFVAQLAQLTSLEQLQQMNSALTNTQAFSAVGKYAYAEVLNSMTGVTEIFTGLVESVAMNNGTTYVVIQDTAVPIDNVLILGDTPFIELPAAGDAETDGEGEGEVGGGTEGGTAGSVDETVSGGENAGGAEGTDGGTTDGGTTDGAGTGDAAAGDGGQTV